LTLFAVASGEYSDYGINAIFSTKELADKYIEASVLAARYGRTEKYFIEEWELDMYTNPTAALLNQAWIDVGTGDVRTVGSNSYKQVFAGPRKCMVQLQTDFRNANRTIYVQSPVSVEHAVKVATEARQAYLADPTIVTDSHIEWNELEEETPTN
jgi:hypothetical protein